MEAWQTEEQITVEKEIKVVENLGALNLLF